MVQKTTKLSKILLVIMFLLLVLFLGIVMIQRSSAPAQVVGVFWQPNLETEPKGNWHLLGVNTFVPQFGIIDKKYWFPSRELHSTWQKIPDWAQVQQQPWAKNLILGLSGDYDETQARAQVVQHGIDSIDFIKSIHLNSPPKGYYFPVEADPTWLRVNVLGKTLSTLPKPLFVSIYSAEAQPEYYALWLKSWLPNETSVFFQDGVGTGVRTPEQALTTVSNLQQNFGRERIIIVLEAFRIQHDGTFRAAYPWEIIQQLKAYEGQKVYIFDGPHYLNKITVWTLYLWQKLAYL